MLPAQPVIFENCRLVAREKSSHCPATPQCSHSQCLQGGCREGKEWSASLAVASIHQHLTSVPPACDSSQLC